jgi:hypothetical protein
MHYYRRPGNSARNERYVMNDVPVPEYHSRSLWHEPPTLVAERYRPRRSAHDETPNTGTERGTFCEHPD